MLLDHYQYLIINNFEKLLKQKDVNKTLKLAISIILIISIYMRLTKLLEVSPSNAKYDL